MKLALFLLLALTLTSCAHKPNLQYECKVVGNEPATGKVLSSCE